MFVHFLLILLLVVLFFVWGGEGGFALFTCLFLSSSDSISIVLFRRKDKTVNSVISCPEVCTSDVINKAGMGAQSTRYVRGRPLCAFHW